MLINRSLKIRLYPTQEQETLINQTIGNSRAIFNMMLFERIQIYEKWKESGKDKVDLYKQEYKTEKDYKEEFDWMKVGSASALQQSRIDLITAYSNFFKSLKGTRKGQKIGFPKFKKKRNSGSFREVQSLGILININEIKIAKIGKIKFKHKGIKSWFKEATIKSITISKTASGKYFASCLFEEEQDFKGYQDLSGELKITGLDMSMDKFYVDELGNSPNYIRLFRKNEKVLAKFQRKMSQKAKVSKNREKARIKVARVHESISNQRKDFIEKLSLKLVRENDVVVLESLSLSGMKQALKLGKSVSDLGYASFVSKLRYKALWSDKTVILADKWFASSKTCSCCGFKKKDLLLHERSWTCSNCGSELNRDQNAGQNLKDFGIKLLVPQELREFTSMEMKTSEIGLPILSLIDEVEKSIVFTD